MFKRIDHIEIAPADFERTLTFYQDVIGFTLSSRLSVTMPPLREIAFLKLGDTMLEMLGMIEPDTTALTPAQVGYRAMALEVDDMEQTARELAAKGIPIVWGPINLGDSLRAEIRDPDGLTIELRQWLTS
jgi:glyoxylase I family protein